VPPIAVNAFKANAQSTKQSMSDDDYSMDVDDFEDFDEPSPPPMPGPSVPLKGRKRFLADLVEGAPARREIIHFVTAREMVNIIWAACDGREGNPGQYRNYRLKLAGESSVQAGKGATSQSSRRA